MEKFDEDGFAVIKDFFSTEEVESLTAECASLVNNINISDHLSIFETGKNQVGSEYFLNSGDKISFFFEKDAINDHGDVIVSKANSLNKIGHALHWHSPAFKKMTFCMKIKNLVASLGYKNPVVVQSMYIFKHPRIGGEVVPHQDSTFLYTAPLTTLGLWFPLVDVTVENGCLWFVPGSHKESVHQRFVRNSEKEPLLKLEGTMKHHDDSEYVPVQVKKGDCVIIHGSVIHKSGRNQSLQSRPIYTFHVVEKNAHYSELNWLQASKSLPFPELFETSCEM